MIAIGIVANAAALALLRFAWGRGRGGAPMALAWLCLAAGLASWVIVRGESGFAQGLTSFCALAAAYIAVRFWRSPVAAHEDAKAGAPRTPSVFARRAFAFALAAAAATLAAVLLSGLCYALGARAGLAPADAIVAAGVLAPIVWAMLMCWLLMEQGAQIRLLVVTMLCAVGGLGVLAT